MRCRECNSVYGHMNWCINDDSSVPLGQPEMFSMEPRPLLMPRPMFKPLEMPKPEYLLAPTPPGFIKF